MKEKKFIRRSLPVILLALTLITSCEKDKDDPAANLIGTWQVEFVNVDAKVGGKAMTQYFIDQGVSTSEAQWYTSTFYATIQQGLTGTLTLKSDKTYASDLGGESDMGTWSISSDNKQLTINSGIGFASVFNIDRITVDELKVNWTETGQVDLNDDGVPETITLTVKVIFTK